MIDAIVVDVLLVCMTLWHENASWIACSFLEESIGHRILLTMNQECRALIFTLLWSWINCWTNNRVTGDLTWHLCDVTPIPHYWPFVRNHRIYSTHKGLVMLNLDVVFDVSLTRLLNKQSNCRWYETPWRSNDITVLGNLTLGCIKTKRLKGSSASETITLA